MLLIFIDRSLDLLFTARPELSCLLSGVLDCLYLTDVELQPAYVPLQNANLLYSGNRRGPLGPKEKRKEKKARRPMENHACRKERYWMNEGRRKFLP